MTESRKTPYNSTYPKVAVQWLNQALCFYQSLCLVDSESLRNRHLRVAAKRWEQLWKTDARGAGKSGGGNGNLCKRQSAAKGAFGKKYVFGKTPPAAGFSVEGKSFPLQTIETRHLLCACVFPEGFFFIGRKKWGDIWKPWRKRGKREKPSCFLWASALHLRLYRYRQKSRNPGAFRPENNSTQHPICPIGAAVGLQCPTTGHIYSLVASIGRPPRKE